MARLDDAREEGIAKGLEEGEKAKSLAIARNMLKRNMAVTDIAEITDLSLDEIKYIAH